MDGHNFQRYQYRGNGFYFMNYLAYWALRLGGFVAWNKHRDANSNVPKYLSGVKK